jgi:hypothetical protein
VKTMLRALCLTTFLAAAACGKTAPQNEAPGAGAKADAHAAAGVKPGSHDDWCGEHQVPESQCTKCNPSLVAAFKATGDWCSEHGVPESQCTKCDPSRKAVRPPKAEAK